MDTRSIPEDTAIGLKELLHNKLLPKLDSRLNSIEEIEFTVNQIGEEAYDYLLRQEVHFPKDDFMLMNKYSLQLIMLNKIMKDIM